MASETDQTEVNLLEDKNFLIDLVKRRDNKLSFVPQNGKSEVWIRFERIFYDNIETEFVKCKYCDDIKKQNRSIGTGGLLRHKCQSFLDFSRSQEAIDFDIKFGNNENEEKTNIYNSGTNDGSLGGEAVNQSKEVLDFFNDRNFLISLVESNDDRLKFVPQNRKSEAWTKFERIYFENNETLYVKCKYCNDIQKQTRNIGTGSLLRHKCKAFVDNRKQFIKKCLTVDEKIRFENKTLKKIVKKCLSMIDKCLCISSSIVLEKKQINVLINDYNEWLYENQDLEQSDVDENRDSNCVSHQDLRLRKNDCQRDSDKDSNYDPLSESKHKIVLTSVKKPQILIKPKAQSILRSSLVKKFYSKHAPKIIDPNLTFPCDWPECGKEFKTKNRLKEHKNIHLKIKRFHCLWPGCDAAFLQKHQYDLHTCTHTDEKKYKCDWPECSYKTCRRNMLRRHRRVHTGEKPYKCDWPGCEFMTSNKQGLVGHKYRHTGEKPWKCSWPQCEWSFRQKTHLKAHMLKHTGEKPVICEFVGCDRRFSSRQAMRFHLEKSHKS